MDLDAIATLATGTLSDFSDKAYIVIAAVIGVAVAFFLLHWAWRKIKGSARSRV